MANRYCNLVGSKKISEDFQNINIGFDAVQKDMDSKSSGDHRHPNATDTTDGFMSAQDKAKMDASTAAATPGTLVQRDASGRMKAAAPSAKTDVARKAEVDAVQSDLDSHKADAVMHVTEADHEKLGSIEEGAEVNQNAFAKVNDIEAGEKTDALTFKGGVGIKVTTNPATNEVTITASGESTPGAHGSSHTEHGADPIPVATAKEGGLMSAADKAEFDKIAPEVPKQAAELKEHDKQLQEHAAELEDHEQRIDGMETGLADAPDKPLELRPGLQIVESEQDTPFRMGEVKGRTLINLPGREGNFDYRTSPLFTFFGTSEIVPSTGPIGTKCQKIVCNRTDTAHFGARYELDIDRSKHYVAMAYMENVSCDIPVYFSIAEMKDTGYTSLRLSAKISKGSGMQYLYATIGPAQMENREKLVYYFRGEGTSGAEFRIGPFAFYEITAAEYDAIAKMTPEQVAERYPYVDSMTNVTNPYAIVTGGNLLPPFYEWDGGTSGIFLEPYTQKVVSTGDRMNSATQMPAVEGKTYTLRIEREGDGEIGLDFRDGHNNVLWTSEFVKQDNIIATAPQGTAYMNAWTSAPAAGEFIFRNPVLTVGTEPKPFTPQQRSMLAFETELAAHPVDGSNSDTLFMGDDGLPYVNEMWKKVAVTKYDGKYLSTGATGDAPDVQAVSGDGYFYISIANTDSGWGPDYTPTQDEIKAYFLGWKMGIVGQPRTVLYNGEGGKVWYKISMCTVNAKYSLSRQDWVEYDVPTYPAGIDSAGTYNYPYRLQYLKAKPTVEPVRNYELGATLSAGSNMVEVGSGIVIREKANPAQGGNGDWGINITSLPASLLNHKAATINQVYKRGVDHQWVIVTRSDGSAYGNQRASISNDNFDPAAVYHVTYTMLDPTLPTPIRGTIASNLRGTVSDLVEDVGDVQRRLSVVETQKAEKDAAPPQRIKPTLLNGWEDYGASFERSFYYKDESNIVTVEGLLGEGTPALGTPLFILPKGFRPDRTLIFPVLGWVSGVGDALVRIDVEPTGVVKIGSSNAKNDYLSLQGITFLAMK
ncbi:MAG: hypothetical protein E6230_15120 [Paenibacillus dendritiformis]|nr:hypothetical protein [Paenibacillus dendritiformis]